MKKTLIIPRHPLPRPREVTSVRELTKDDLSRLCEPRRVPHFKKLRDSHHRLAMLFAMGMDTPQVAEQVGYGYERTRRIRSTPAFEQLVSDYRQLVIGAHVDAVDVFAKTATDNMVRAELMLSDRLEEAEDSGDLLPIRDLVNITSDRADRFGYPKKGVNVNINMDFASRLDRARKRSRQVIDAAPPISPAESSAVGDGCHTAIPHTIQRRV